MKAPDCLSRPGRSYKLFYIGILLCLRINRILIIDREGSRLIYGLPAACKDFVMNDSDKVATIYPASC